MRRAATAVWFTLALAATAVGQSVVTAASCAPPVPVAEYAQRADAVVYGRVAALEGARIAKVEVVSVLKGSAPQGIVVLLGPDAGDGPVATSVDYTAATGSDHTFYLRATASGRFETDVCSGTHPGAPTPEETAYFGSGASPQPGGAEPGLGIAGLETSAVIGLAVVAALAVLAGLYALRLSRRRPATTLR